MKVWPDNDDDDDYDDDDYGDGDDNDDDYDDDQGDDYDGDDDDCNFVQTNTSFYKTSHFMFCTKELSVRAFSEICTSL